MASIITLLINLIHSHVRLVSSYSSICGGSRWFLLITRVYCACVIYHRQWLYLNRLMNQISCWQVKEVVLPWLQRILGRHVTFNCDLHTDSRPIKHSQSLHICVQTSGVTVVSVDDENACSRVSLSAYSLSLYSPRFKDWSVLMTGKRGGGVGKIIKQINAPPPLPPIFHVTWYPPPLTQNRII